MTARGMTGIGIGLVVLLASQGCSSTPSAPGDAPSGGSTASGGAALTGGGPGSGGAGGSGGALGSGGAPSSGGTVGSGGNASSGGSTASGGAPASGGSDGVGGGSGGEFTGTCTASEAANTNANGSGPHDVVVETNADPGINEGTIYRPADLGGDEKYPIFVWGEGGCSLDGESNSAAMAEIASYGYFVVADGTPGGTGGRPLLSTDVVSMGEPLIAYIDWAIEENSKPCSAYHQALDTTKVAANGFSCGGLMAAGTAGDPRMTVWGYTSSGLLGSNPGFYESIHTPVLMVEGGSSDQAYPNGQNDYEAISALDVPLVWFSKNIGHGGDLWSAGGGDFTKINLAWLNWWLKGDETASGKGALIGASCSYCGDPAWEATSENVP